jgi:hypothetical protein
VGKETLSGKDIAELVRLSYAEYLQRNGREEAINEVLDWVKVHDLVWEKMHPLAIGAMRFQTTHHLKDYLMEAARISVIVHLLPKKMLQSYLKIIK